MRQLRAEIYNKQLFLLKKVQKSHYLSLFEEEIFNLNTGSLKFSFGLN